MTIEECWMMMMKSVRPMGSEGTRIYGGDKIQSDYEIIIVTLTRGRRSLLWITKKRLTNRTKQSWVRSIVDR